MAFFSNFDWIFYLKVTNGLKEIKKQVNLNFSFECNLRINSKDKE